MDPLLSDILDQPRALRAALAAGVPAAAPLGGRVVLCGMGASYFATYPAYLRLLRAGVAVSRLEAGELLHFGREVLCPGTTAVVVSQSGRSAEVVRLLEARGGATVVGVTNDPRSPLGLGADGVVTLEAGPEAAGVATKTLACTLLRCDLLAGGDPGAWPAEVAAVETLLRDRERWLPELLSALGPAEHVFVLGRGPALAAALGTALMLKEAGAVHAEGLSVPQFRHGPLEAARPGRAALVLVSPGDLGGFDLALAAEMAAAGMSVAALCPEPRAAPPGVRALAWPSAGPAALLVAGQCLAHAFALRRGIVPGTFERVGKVTTRE